MREVQFLKQNQEKWRELEKLINSNQIQDPDQLSDNYIELLDDLSYAKTFYPKGKSQLYLNKLAQNLHLQIYQNKKEDKSKFKTFWMKELPLIYYEKRNVILFSFLVFVLFTAIGWVSGSGDETFVRLILGDQYVNITESNIENNDPLAIYKSSKEISMFLEITIHNILVSFWAFLFGIFLSVGTIFIIMRNAIMIGSFHYMFYQNDQLLQALQTIWIHGVIEITAIIIASSAGMVIGNSILFPGTYSRKDSITINGKKGIQMVLGLVPFFIIAGFIESFITRHYLYSTFLNISIIASSLIIVAWYFIFLPRKIYMGANYE